MGEAKAKSITQMGTFRGSQNFRAVGAQASIVMVSHCRFKKSSFIQGRHGYRGLLGKLTKDCEVSVHSVKHLHSICSPHGTVPHSSPGACHPEQSEGSLHAVRDPHLHCDQHAVPAHVSVA